MIDVLFAIISAKYALPISILSSICFIETGHKSTRIEHDNGSPSIGICQIKLATARQMGYKGKEKDLIKPEVNIEYAARYLRYQMDRYHGDFARAITAYNRGSERGNGGSDYLAKVFNEYVRRTEDSRESDGRCFSY